MSKQKEIDIDLLSLLKVLWSKKVLIVIATVFCGLLGWLVSSFLITPTYTSSTRIYVVNQQSSEAALTAQDLQVGDYLVKDYSEIITSVSVLDKVIADQKLSMTSADLLGKLSVTIPTNTRIITISVSDPNPKQAASLANALRKVASDKIQEVTKVSDVTTLEEAVEPQAPSGPNTRRNALLAALVGLVISVSVVLVAELLNDQVRKPEDVEEAMSLPLLAVIPDTDKLS